MIHVVRMRISGSCALAMVAWALPACAWQHDVCCRHLLQRDSDPLAHPRLQILIQTTSNLLAQAMKRTDKSLQKLLDQGSTQPGAPLGKYGPCLEF